RPRGVPADEDWRALNRKRRGDPRGSDTHFGLRLDQVRLAVEVQEHGFVEGEVDTPRGVLPVHQCEELRAVLLDPHGLLLLLVARRGILPLTVAAIERLVADLADAVDENCFILRHVAISHAAAE